MNKLERKEYNKQYYEANKEKIKKYQKEYNKENKNKVKAKQKQYYEENKDRKKQYYEENKEKIKKYQKEYNKQYYQDNKDKINKQQLNPNGYIIYMHINKLNNKKYIGKTKFKINRRIRGGYRKNKSFNDLLEKYGWDLFYTKIIETNLTKEEADKLEKHYITFFNTTDNNYGYNIYIGGK